MNDFYRGYILSYFKDHKQHYSFLFLAQNLGLAVSSIDELVSELIEDDQLAYGSNNMLMLTPKGRLTILNDRADYLSFDGNRAKEGIIHPENALSLDEVYIPAGFMSKLK